ncbi:MAG: hypothetical protein HOC70_16095 [Gammaproteobacteria bacterium]|jgi:hypothetical protein|nr:hypothetical protein [Gammaproteobacteria bacterium]MBT7370173.1 hypothetical protein [Gammaproteobacteria bacterium]
MASMEDILKKFPLDEDRLQRLYELQTECAIVWETEDHWPVGVMHRYLWRDGKMWATCSGLRHRVKALQRNPKSSVIITGLGTELGPVDTTVTIKTTAVIHSDRETKDWFYLAMGERMNPNSQERAVALANNFDTPNRIVLELTPHKIISYDGRKLAAAMADGTLDD